MKFLYALSIDHGETDPDEVHRSKVYKTPEMPKTRNELRNFIANRTGDHGYVHSQRFPSVIFGKIFFGFFV